MRTSVVVWLIGRTPPEKLVHFNSNNTHKKHWNKQRCDLQLGHLLYILKCWLNFASLHFSLTSSGRADPTLEKHLTSDVFPDRNSSDRHLWLADWAPSLTDGLNLGTSCHSPSHEMLCCLKPTSLWFSTSPPSMPFLIVHVRGIYTQESADKSNLRKHRVSRPVLGVWLIAKWG